MSKSRKISDRSTARSSGPGASIPAMSSSVRATDVTGIPATRTTSSVRMVRQR